MGNNKATPVYDMKDVGKILGVSRITLYRYMKTGQLPYRKIGKFVRFLPQDLKVFFDRNKVDKSSLNPSVLSCP